MPSITCSNCGATGRTKKNADRDVPALAFLNRARQYPEAAEELFAAGERRASVGGQRAITEPISFLYYHTMELAFKAYRRANNRPHEYNHELTDLYEHCRKWGLVIERDDQLQMRGLVSVLESGDAYLRFRYFPPNSTSQPDLAWTREVVAALMQNVSEQMPVGSILPKGGKAIVSWSKPRLKDDSKTGKVVFTVGKEIPKKDDFKI